MSDLRRAARYHIAVQRSQIAALEREAMLLEQEATRSTGRCEELLDKYERLNALVDAVQRLPEYYWWIFDDDGKHLLCRTCGTRKGRKTHAPDCPAARVLAHLKALDKLPEEAANA